jgi:hypothetical protein
MAEMTCSKGIVCPTCKKDISVTTTGLLGGVMKQMFLQSVFEPKEKKVVPEFDYTHLLNLIKKNPLNLNVINHLKKIAKHLNSEPSDFGMIGMYFDDAANHLMIGRYIALNEFKKASRLAHDIDTAPRDDIPESTWDFIESYND